MEPVILTSWDSPFISGTGDVSGTAGKDRLGTDHDPVFDLGDAGRRPGDALRFFALDPGANGTLQYHLAAMGFDGDPVGVHFGAALECFLDLAFNLRGLHL